MSYFTKSFLQFLSELSVNNERDWFNANKKRFKEEVEKPFTAFVADLIDQVGAVDPKIVLTPKDAIFRIYRDTRFSKDKTPYKTHMAAAINEGGRKGTKTGGIYIHSSFDSFKIYTGFYMPTPKQVKMVREAIVSDLNGFSKIINKADFKKYFGTIQGEEHKRVPKEFAEFVEQQPLLMKKSYYAVHNLDAEVILQEDLIDQCMQHFLVAQPLGEFFDEAIGE